MKLTHKIGRPGYKSGINMSPLKQTKKVGASRYRGKIKSIQPYALGAQNYQQSREDQMNVMTEEQLANLDKNDTIFYGKPQFNTDQVAIGNIPVKDKDYFNTAIFPPSTISTDADYEVINNFDPSLNRPRGDERNKAVVNIPKYTFSPGKKQTLLGKGEAARTEVSTFKDLDGNQTSQPRYAQLEKDYTDAMAAQEAFDAETAALIAANQ